MDATERRDRFRALHSTGTFVIPQPDVTVWDTATWKEHKKLTGVKGAVWSCAFSPDSQTVFAAGDDGLGRFWAVVDGKEKFACSESHEKTVNWVAWAPDGGMVVGLQDGVAVTGGAFRRFDGSTAQLKRIWTDARYRRRGAPASGGSTARRRET